MKKQWRPIAVLVVLALPIALAFQNCAEVAFESSQKTNASLGAPGSSDANVDTIDGSGSSNADVVQPGTSDGSVNPTPVPLPTPTPIPPLSPTPPPAPITNTTPPPTPPPQPSPTPTPEPGIGPFRWQTGTFGSCETICGDGQELRPVTCYDEGAAKVVSDFHCSAQPKPESARACFIDNPSCEVWVKTPSEFMALKDQTFKYACVQRSIDFNDTAVDSRFRETLNSQTLDGCGHSLDRLSFKTRGLFTTLTSRAKIKQLEIKDPLVNVIINSSGIPSFGMVTDHMMDKSVLEDIEVTVPRKMSISITAPSSWCSGVVGHAQGERLYNISFKAQDIDMQCYFAGLIAGRIWPYGSTIKAENISASWQNLNYLGSGYKINGQDYFNDGVIGGFVGRYWGTSLQLVDEFRNIQTKGTIYVKKGVGAVGGVVGQIFQQKRPTPPVFDKLSFTGSIIGSNLYCENNFPFVGGVLGHFFPSESTTIPVVVSNSTFAGGIRFNECNPAPLHESRTIKGKKLNVGLAHGGGYQINMIEFPQFQSVGDIRLRVLDTDLVISSNPLPPIYWRMP